jgi:hypothetical protein
MTKNWMLTESFGPAGIAFPNKQILIPITIKHKEVSDFTLNQWLVANVVNAARKVDNDVLLAVYEYGNMTPETKIFRNKSIIQVVCRILSITEKEIKIIIPKIPKKYYGVLIICECTNGDSVWALKNRNGKIIL